MFGIGLVQASHSPPADAAYIMNIGLSADVKQFAPVRTCSLNEGIASEAISGPLPAITCCGQALAKNRLTNQVATIELKEQIRSINTM
jgi:hypothetical protein